MQVNLLTTKPGTVSDDLEIRKLWRRYHKFLVVPVDVPASLEAKAYDPWSDQVVSSRLVL